VGTGYSRDAPEVVELEKVLAEEEKALLELQSKLEAQSQVLVGQTPLDILTRLQDVEAALGRLRQLETSRGRLLARLTGVAGAPGHNLLLAAKVLGLPVSERLMALRHSLLGAVAKVAESTAVNDQLLAGLARVNGAAIIRLTQLQATQSPDLAYADSGLPVVRRTTAIDVQA
jgi:hypothetical protein